MKKIFAALLLCMAVSLASCQKDPDITPVSKVTLDKETLPLLVGDKATLVATVTPGNATDITVTWESSDPSVATVSVKGEVIAVAAGTTTITVKSVQHPDLVAICKVTVETPFRSMSMTIDTRKNIDNPSDATFILPFGKTISGYSMIVDWGDGNTNEYPDGTVLDKLNMTHTYPKAEAYTITITTSQIDSTQVQMPQFNFWGNYGYQGKDEPKNYNAAKLISINSPLLNMGKDFYTAFYGCENLTSIPENLLENNTEATDFSCCFDHCTGLVSIPEKLFHKNVGITSFSECFESCVSLTSIPEKLFEKNTAAKIFGGCFRDCKGLTEIPALLFEKNTSATSFTYCFAGCTGLTSIPELLFAKNTAAVRFDHTFNGCTNIELNANIFCMESDDTKAKRFAGIQMHFFCCFKDCGSDASVTSAGTAPALWDYAMNLGDYAPGSRCFEGVTKLTNVDEIPSEWIKSGIK